MTPLPKTRYQDPSLAAAYFIAETTGKTKLLPASVVKDHEQWLYNGTNAEIKKNMQLILKWLTHAFDTPKLMYKDHRNGIPKVTNNIITDDAAIYAMYFTFYYQEEDYERWKVTKRGYQLNKGSISQEDHDKVLAKSYYIFEATIDAVKQNIKGL